MAPICVLLSVGISVLCEVQVFIQDFSPLEFVATQIFSCQGLFLGFVRAFLLVPIFGFSIPDFATVIRRLSSAEKYKNQAIFFWRDEAGEISLQCGDSADLRRPRSLFLGSKKENRR